MKHQKYAIYAAALWELVHGAKSEEETTGIVKAFAEYLQARRQTGLLPKIQKALMALEQKKNGIVDAEVISAIGLADKEKERVIGSLAVFFKKDSTKIDARFAVDDSLLGGLVVRTNEMIIDGTVRMKLEKLKKVLIA